jgi:exopolysaccharide biosynthesis polyprenyl glycosylphosphotransferase
MIILGFITAYYWRKHQGDIVSFWSFNEYIRFIILLIPAWISVFAIEGLYNIKKSRQGIDEFVAIILGVSFGIMLVVAWIFLSRTFFFSRLIIIYSWIFVIIYTIIGRNLVRLIQRYLYKYSIGVYRLLIIGNNEVTYNIIKYIQNNPNVGYKVIGVVNSNNDDDKIDDFSNLGELADLEKIIDKNVIDEIIVTDNKLSESATLNVIQIAEDKKITFRQTPNLFGVRTSNIDVATIAGIPIVEYKKTPLDGWWKVIKRIVDILGSTFGIILFSPILIVVAILIKLDSKGPLIYKSERVNDQNQNFHVYKFRTMKIELCTGNGYGGKDAEELEKKLIDEKSERQGPVYKVIDDPRRTKLGKFLERTSLDELPQFFNVLFGTLSLVGPRPHQPREVEKYKQWHKKVFRIKPGLTGMAQISGRSDLDFDEEARLDIFYIENWNIWLDFKIIIKTPLAMIKPRKVS